MGNPILSQEHSCVSRALDVDVVGNVVGSDGWLGNWTPGGGSGAGGGSGPSWPKHRFPRTADLWRECDSRDSSGSGDGQAGEDPVIRPSQRDFLRWASNLLKKLGPFSGSTVGLKLLGRSLRSAVCAG